MEKLEAAGKLQRQSPGHYGFVCGDKEA